MGSLKLLRLSKMLPRQQRLQPARAPKERRPLRNLELQVSGLTEEEIDQAYHAEELCKYDWSSWVSEGMQVYYDKSGAVCSFPCLPFQWVCLPK